MTTDKGVWNLQQVRDKQLQSLWDYSTTLTNLYAWGDNTFGELYLAGVTGGEPAKRSSPVQIPGTTWKDFMNVSGKATYSSMASKNDGTLWGWGRNQYGSIGNNTITYTSSPVQIPGTNWTGTYDTMSSGYSTSRAIKTDGTMWSWGRNETGWLGLNEGANPGPSKSSPCQIPGSTWTSNYAVTYQGVLAIKTDGTLWAWGKNRNG